MWIGLDSGPGDNDDRDNDDRNDVRGHGGNDDENDDCDDMADYHNIVHCSLSSAPSKFSMRSVFLHFFNWVRFLHFFN